MSYIADILNYKKLNEIYNLQSCTNEMVVEVTYVTMHNTQQFHSLVFGIFPEKTLMMCRGCGDDCADDDSNVISKSLEVIN